MGKKYRSKETLDIYNNLNNHQKVHLLQMILWNGRVDIYRYVKGQGCFNYKFEDANLNGAGIDIHIKERDD
jgi:hypothetical protein